MDENDADNGIVVVVAEVKVKKVLSRDDIVDASRNKMCGTVMCTRGGCDCN